MAWLTNCYIFNVSGVCSSRYQGHSKEIPKIMKIKNDLNDECPPRIIDVLLRSGIAIYVYIYIYIYIYIRFNQLKRNI